jgi:superfamily II DNA or RNA helicase
MIELKDYQLVPINFLKQNRGIILYHSTGSGKTLTALYGAYQFNYSIIIIGTKSSKKTFRDNIEKAEMDKSRFTFYTFAKIKVLLESDISMLKNHTVIVDEAHNIRNENLHNLYIASALSISKKVILLTATPVINYLNDLSVLVNIIKGEDTLPTDHLLFDQMFYDEDNQVLINQDILFSKLQKCISYYKMEDDENYPRSTVHYINVEMSHQQVAEYIFYIRKILYDDKGTTDTIDILNIDYGLLPSKKKNFFLNVTRQLSNTVKNDSTSPKIIEIYQKIVEGPSPSIVYSNYLKNGIYTLAELLEKNNIKYRAITGHITDDKLNLIVDNYNKGAYQVLLISSAGSESLDLKSTRQIHIMEPHWNESRINQVIGRSIRYQSHNNLPISERHVDIYRWISTFKNNIKNDSADQYLTKLSIAKNNVWEKFQDIIKKASIERFI